MCALDTAVGKCSAERVAHGQVQELSGEANVHVEPLELSGHNQGSFSLIGTDTWPRLCGDVSGFTDQS